jgi:hypothetical protein
MSHRLTNTKVFNNISKIDYFELYMKTYLKLNIVFPVIGMTTGLYHGYQEIKQARFNPNPLVEDYLTVSRYGAFGLGIGYASAYLFPVAFSAAAVVSYNRWKNKY